MAKQATVTLGEREFLIHELPTKPAELWRKRLGEELQPVMTLIQQIPALIKDADSLADIKVSGELLEIITEPVKSLAFESLPAVRELVITYSRTLEAEREWLEANAYDSEFVEALVECLKLAYPFGSLAPAVGKMLALGPQKPATSQS